MSSRSFRGAFLFGVGLMGSVGLVLASPGSVLVTTPAGAAPPPVPVSSCPPPVLPPGTPAPTSVAGPVALSPPMAPTAAAPGPGQCQWTYDLPSAAGDPTVTFTYLGTSLLTVGTNKAVNLNEDGVNCNMHVEVLNGFGGAGAQETLNSGNCNTDTYSPGEGSVQVVGVGYDDGPLETVGSFNNTVTSFVSGVDVFFGDFTACSQNPVGQHATYSCVYFYGGPLF